MANLSWMNYVIALRYCYGTLTNCINYDSLEIMRNMAHLIRLRCGLFRGGEEIRIMGIGCPYSYALINSLSIYITSAE